MSHGRRAELPEPVEPPGRDIGQIERGHAIAPDAAGRRHDRRQGREIGRVVAALDVRHAGADHRLGKAAAPRDAQAPLVDVGADALLGPEHLVADRLVDHAGDELAVALERHRDREERQPVQEIGGAVQGIDDPAMAPVARRLAALLHEEAIARPRARNSALRMRSAFRSAFETNSPGPLIETWS